MDTYNIIDAKSFVVWKTISAYSMYYSDSGHYGFNIKNDDGKIITFLYVPIKSFIVEQVIGN